MTTLSALRFDVTRSDAELCTIDPAQLQTMLARDPATPTVYLLAHGALEELLAAAAVIDKRLIADRGTQNTTETEDGPQTTRLAQTLGPAQRHAAQRLAYGQAGKLQGGVRKFLEWLRARRRPRALYYFVSTDPALWDEISSRATKLSPDERRLRDLETVYVGPSRAAAVVRTGILKAARARRDLVIMVQGESGTGKEIVARAIHDCSDRRERPFVAVNCAAISKSMADDALFGHQKGAYTGAVTDRAGLFEEANEGTIFFDEIGDMSAEVQAMILRTIQDRKVRRLGATKWLTVDVKIVTATHKNLNAMVERGDFRGDLLHRLSGYWIVTPSLRDHPEDLDAHVVRIWQAELGHPPLPAPVLQLLRAWEWTGNVRELETALRALDLEAETEPISRGMMANVLRRRMVGVPPEVDERPERVEDGPAPGSLDEQVRCYRETRPSYARLEHALRTLVERLVKPVAPLAVVRSRTLSVGQFAERLQREGSPRHANGLPDWRDLSEVRVIVYMQQQKQSVLAELWKYCEIVDVAHEPARDVDLSSAGFRPLEYFVRVRALRVGELARSLDVELPAEACELWGCVRLHTVLEEVGLALGDEVVPSGAPLPKWWEQKLATLESVVGGVQRVVGRIYDDARTWAGSYGAYRSEAEVRRELATLEAVLARVPDDASIAARAGKLAIILGDWSRAIAILEPHVDAAYPPVLRDLGVALCKPHEVGTVGHQRGLGLLEDACRLAPYDPDAFASLAGALKRAGQLERARDSYRRAVDIDGADPYALGGYLETSLVLAPDVDVIGSLRPAIERAILRCRDRIAASVDLPWAAFDLGKFLGLLGESRESLAAYVDGIGHSTAPFMLETTLRSVETLLAFPSVPAEMEVARRMLAVGWCARFPSEEARARLRAAEATVRTDLRGPAVMLVQADDAPSASDAAALQAMLAEGLRGFRGTVAVVGDGGWAAQAVRGVVKASCPDARVIQYPSGSYATLPAWADLLASNVSAGAIRVLLIGDDEVVTAADGRLAGYLAGRVGLLPVSGEESAAAIAGVVTIRSGRDLARFVSPRG